MVALYVIGQTIIFFALWFLSFSSPNLSGRRLDVYHVDNRKKLVRHRYLLHMSS